MKNCVWLTGTGRTNRVHRIDAGWSPEAFEVCRVEDDKGVSQDSEALPELGVDQ